MSDKAIAIKPNYPVALFSLGLAHQAQCRLDEAAASYRQAIALQPDYVEAHNNLGVTLKDQGKFEDAVASYQRAITLMPGYAEAHYNLGNVLLAQSRFAEALASYDNALALKPDDAKAFNNRGAALRELKRFEEALASYRQAIALKPDYAEAHNNLGVTLKNQGKLAEAVTRYQRAIALKPDYVEAHTNLGVAYWDQGKLGDALASYDRALALNPDYADALTNRCNLFIELGRLAEAEQAVEQAIRLAPRKAPYYRTLAMLRRFTDGDRYVAAMEVLVQDAQSLSINDRIELYFALAKAYDDLGQFEKAFNQLLAGNAFKRQQIVYDEAAELGELEQIRKAFTRELFHRREGGGEHSKVPVFIVGMPRSGSTLVAQILASHPMVVSPGEMKCFENAVANLDAAENRVQASSEQVTTMSDEQFRQLGKSYLAEIEPLAPEAERIVDKMLSNHIYVGLIHLALPNATIIHTIRHPVDTCISCFFSLFTTGHLYSYDLAELGRYYRRYQALMAHWHNVLPPGRILDVHYEDVVANLENAARRIIAHCGLEWDAHCLTFYQTKQPVRTASAVQVRQPIYRSSVGRWRGYQATLAPLLAELEAGE